MGREGSGVMRSQRSWRVKGREESKIYDIRKKKIASLRSQSLSGTPVPATAHASREECLTDVYITVSKMWRYDLPPRLQRSSAGEEPPPLAPTCSSDVPDIKIIQPRWLLYVSFTLRKNCEFLRIS